MLHRALVLAAVALSQAVVAQQYRFSLALDPVNASHGVKVAVGGDGDGDGRRDFVALEIGVHPTLGLTQQVVRLCSGTDGHQLAQYSNPSTQYFFRCVASVGDFNGDSVPDVAIGSDTGVHVRSGTNLQWIASFGTSCLAVIGAGDINGDSFPDLFARMGAQSPTWFAVSGLTGASLWAAGDGEGCRIDLVNGVASLAVYDGVAVRVFAGASGQQLWQHLYGGWPGRRVTVLGDSNLDAVPDVAVSTPQFCQGGVCQGTVEVLSGATGQTILAVTRSDPYGGFGYELAAAGNLDGTGRMGFLASSSNSPTRLFGVSGAGAEVFTMDGAGFHGLVGGFDLEGDGLAEFGFERGNGPGLYFDIYSLVRASFTTFGVGCPGAQGVPSLHSTSLPRIGQNFALQVTNLAPVQLGFVFTGFSDQVWGQTSLQLPLSLGVIGMPACTMLISPDIDAVTWSAGSTANWGFTIPSTSTLYGFEFFNQAFFIDAQAPGGLVVSNAGHGIIGT
jgi:hypothetical protein